MILGGGGVLMSEVHLSAHEPIRTVPALKTIRFKPGVQMLCTCRTLSSMRICPEAGLYVPRRAFLSRGGPICPEAGLPVPKRDYPTRFPLRALTVAEADGALLEHDGPRREAEVEAASRLHVQIAEGREARGGRGLRGKTVSQ